MWTPPWLSLGTGRPTGSAPTCTEQEGVCLASHGRPGLAEALGTLERGSAHRCFLCRGLQVNEESRALPDRLASRSAAEPGFPCSPFHPRAQGAAARPGGGGLPTQGDQGNEVSLHALSRPMQGLPEGWGQQARTFANACDFGF